VFYTLSSLVFDLLQELSEVVFLKVQELHFFFSLGLVSDFTLFRPHLVRSNSRLDLDDFVLLALLFIFLLLNFLFQIGLAMLSKLLLAHSKGNGTIVKSHVGLSSLADVVADTQEQESSLRLV